jgi:hypothetical protein
MENKIVLFGKEYELKLTRGGKDFTSNTLAASAKIVDNDDGFSANFDLILQPKGDALERLESKFIEAVKNGFNEEMNALKEKQEQARQGASSEKKVN